MGGELQHYVPRFLLKNFTHGKKPKIFVYDKSNDQRFQTNIKNVAAEGGFYDLKLADSVLTLEPSLANLEAKASDIIKKLVSEQNTRGLSDNETAILAVFLAVQFVRTKEHRVRFEHLDKLLKEKLRPMGATDENIKDITKRPDGLPEDKLVGLRAVIGIKELVPHFLNKAWVLFETNRKTPFYISDNPVTLHNEIDHGPYGNLGLAVRGIEIYLPLSTSLCLGLLCPSIAEQFQTAHEQIKALDKLAPGFANSVMKNPEGARAFCEGLVSGNPINIIEESVTMLNSLQVMFSSRFVYCETDTFALAEKMLNDNKSFRQGLKPTVS